MTGAMASDDPSHTVKADAKAAAKAVGSDDPPHTAKTVGPLKAGQSDDPSQCVSEITGKGGGVVNPGDKAKYSDGDKIPLSVTGTATAICLCVDVDKVFNVI